MDRAAPLDYNKRMGLMRSGPDTPRPKTSTATKLLWLAALFIFVLLIAALVLR